MVNKINAEGDVDLFEGATLLMKNNSFGGLAAMESWYRSAKRTSVQISIKTDTAQNQIYILNIL